MKDKRARVEAFHQELESKHGGKYSRPQYGLWAEVIDIGTHASEEESNLGTSFRNVMKTTTNSAISESCRRMYVAKTVTSALKGNKKPPKQVAPPILDTWLTKIIVLVTSDI